MPDFMTLLTAMIERRGSDLHLIPGSPPRLRVEGRLVTLEADPLTGLDTHHLVREILDERQQQRFQEAMTFDCAVSVEGVGRVRCHLYRERGSVALAFRAIPSDIPSFDSLGLPRMLGDLVHKPRGVVFVTGPTGSGKSTTLAALVDKINTERRAHVLTIEDPVEFLHPHKKSVIAQREVGTDTPNVHAALGSVIRQNPDVVLLGEIKKPSGLEAALSLAETGHLILAALSTPSTGSSLLRIIESFPPHRHSQVRAQLAVVLQGVVSQQLLPKAEGSGRVLALEILIPTVAVRNLIRENKLSHLYSVMQTGQAKHGMQTMNQALLDLYKRRLVSASTILAVSHDPGELQRLMDRAGSPVRPRLARSPSTA